MLAVCRKCDIDIVFDNQYCCSVEDPYKLAKSSNCEQDSTETL